MHAEHRGVDAVRSNRALEAAKRKAASLAAFAGHHRSSASHAGVHIVPRLPDRKGVHSKRAFTLRKADHLVSCCRTLGGGTAEDPALSKLHSSFEEGDALR